MSLQVQKPENKLSKSDEAYRSHGWRVVEKLEEVIACLQSQLNHKRWEAHHREAAQLQKFKCEENRLKQEARDWKKSQAEEHQKEIEELKKLGAEQLRAQDNKHRKELGSVVPLAMFLFWYWQHQSLLLNHPYFRLDCSKTSRYQLMTDETIINSANCLLI